MHRWKRIDAFVRLKTLSAVVRHSTVVGHVLWRISSTCVLFLAACSLFLVHMYYVIHFRVVYYLVCVSRSKWLAILNLAIRRQIRQIAKLKASQKFPAAKTQRFFHDLMLLLVQHTTWGTMSAWWWRMRHQNLLSVSEVFILLHDPCLFINHPQWLKCMKLTHTGPTNLRHRKLKDGYQNIATLWQVDFVCSCNNITISSYLLSQTLIDYQQSNELVYQTPVFSDLSFRASWA